MTIDQEAVYLGDFVAAEDLKALLGSKDVDPQDEHYLIFDAKCELLDIPFYYSIEEVAGGAYKAALTVGFPSVASPPDQDGIVLAVVRLLGSVSGGAVYVDACRWRNKIDMPECGEHFCFGFFGSRVSLYDDYLAPEEEDGLRFIRHLTGAEVERLGWIG